MQFLDKCLEVPDTCFKTGNKEKAWTKFHAAVIDSNNTEPIKNLLGPDVSPWMFFALFQEMLRDAFCVKITERQVLANTLSEHEKDVTSYIGGAVVQKLRQKAYRLRDSEEKHVILECVQHLSVDEARKGSMIEILDRGGLIKLHPSIELLFEALETKFRCLYSGYSIRLSFEAFFQECVSLDEVSTAFYNQIYEVRAQENLKEKLLRDMTFLYFKTRAHHKCKTFMDDYYRQTHKEKREKALRKRMRQNAK